MAAIFPLGMGADRGIDRRGFIGGAIAAGAAHVLVNPAASAAAAKPCTPTPPGFRTGALAVTPDRRTVWTADSAARTITAHTGRALTRGRSIDVGGAPNAIAISPDGTLALVTTAFYDHPGLAIVDLVTGEVDRVDVGAEPYAVAFTPDGRHAYVTGGGKEGTLTRVDPKAGRVHAPIALGHTPRGLAIHPDGKRALVALSGASALAYVKLATRSVRRIATPAFPSQLAISPDGTKALVTHSGFGDRQITPIDLEHRKAGKPATVGADLAGVAYTRSGRQALVAGMGARAVFLVDGRSGRRRKTVKQAGTPRAVAFAGTRAIVADGATGFLTAIRTGR
jgi:DNA-binding beta-propeller fold protein YncE